jgi:hypothetical protein
LASSLLVACGAAAAQTQPTPAQTTSERGVGTPASGRNAFIAPVVDIRIQDQGLALPKGLEEPAITAPAPTPTAVPADAKSEPAKSQPPATGK